jgi:RimJ/RimL family protein N-acetyltransferase
MSRWIQPVVLRGQYATLDALKAAAADGELWRLWYTSVPAPATTRDYIETALDMRERLGAMPFVVRQSTDGVVVGSTRYFNVDERNQRLDIGFAWYARRVQRTAVNTECSCCS